MTSPEPVGVLPIDKPAGPTSHDVVAMARRALRLRRIGHTGTLDPFASGLLLLCLGQATRVAEYLTRLPKTYHATARFGAGTDTDDLTGEIVASSDGWQQLGRDQVAAALESQRGARLQVPPAYSAKKLAGRRAYELARGGEAVTPAAVEVVIHEIRLEAWSPPDASFETTCSSGTYIRAIARDAGHDLGVPAHLTALRRTATGGFDVARALSVEQLADEAAVRAALVSPLQALAGLPVVQLQTGEVAAIRHGRSVRRDAPDAEVVAVAEGETLVAIASLAEGLVRPRKVFAA